MKTIGIKVEFAIAQWPANMKSALAGSLQMWMLGSSADVPDGQGALQRTYGPAGGQADPGPLQLPAFDAIYERMLALPDSPQRLALFHEAKRIAAAYMPYKVFVHRIANDVAHPWMVGYRRPLFWNNWWHMVDVDVARRPAA